MLKTNGSELEDMMNNQNKKQPNTFAVIGGDLVLEATLDRVIILQDPERTGMECTKCDGTGHTEEKCPHCKGTGCFKGNVEDGPCPDCEIGTSDARKSLGYVLCSVCKGNGTSSIIIPDDQKTRPTTGKIVSLGPLANYYRNEGEWVPLPENAHFKVGDKVMFTNYSGTVFELGKKREIKIRYLRANEVLSKLHGIVAKSPEAGEFRELEAVGIQDRQN